MPNHVSCSEKSLPFLSCTEQKPYWGKVAKVVSESVLQPSMIKDLKEMQLSERQTYEVTEDELEYCRASLLSGSFKVNSLRRIVVECVRNFPIFRPKVSNSCFFESSQCSGKRNTTRW